MDLMICALKPLPENRQKKRKKKERMEKKMKKGEEEKNPLSSHLPELQLQNLSPICTALYQVLGFPWCQSGKSNVKACKKQ